jgi:hypothetical protein
MSSSAPTTGSSLLSATPPVSNGDMAAANAGGGGGGGAVPPYEMAAALVQLRMEAANAAADKAQLQERSHMLQSLLVQQEEERLAQEAEVKRLQVGLLLSSCNPEYWVGL